MKRIMKEVALLVLGSNLMLQNKLHRIREAESLTILNLHRVSKNDGSSYRPLEPFIFEELLIFLQKNFDMTTFDALATDNKMKRSKCILSFDDGYKDFIDVAAPILQKYKMRVNQNIIPDCVEKQLPPLNVIAQDFVGTAPLALLQNLDIPDFDVKRFGTNRALLGNRLSHFLKSRPISEQRKLGDILLPQFTHFDGFKPTPMMSKEDIRQLWASHEIGVHSYAHASMEFETDDFFRQDCLDCNSYFQSNFGKTASISVFPNGSHRQSQLPIAYECGYQHILLVDNQYSRAGNKIHSRFGFDAQSKREAYFKALGGLTST